MKKIKILVNTNNNKYPIIIGTKLMNNVSNLLNKNSIDFNKCLLIIDKKIPKKFTNQIIKSLKKKKIFIHFFNASEKIRVKKV